MDFWDEAKMNVFHMLEISGKWGKDSTSHPEFGHTQGEIQNKPAKKYISIQGGGMKLRKIIINFDGFFWVSSCLSFFLSASTAAAT